MTKPTDTARQAAERLFTNGNGDVATRLVLVDDDSMLNVDLGGWCKESVVREIQSAIDTETAALRAENERLRERVERLASLCEATGVEFEGVTLKQILDKIKQLTAERDALRKKTIDLEGMLATAHEAANKAVAERDAANQRTERTEAKLEELQRSGDKKGSTL